MRRTAALPLLLLAALLPALPAAAQTERIRFGTSIVPAFIQHPIKLLTQAQAIEEIARLKERVARLEERFGNENVS